MINLHYEIRICPKSYNRVTMTVYIKCVVLFNLHKMLFIIYYHNLVIIVDETWVSVSSRMGIDVLKGYLLFVGSYFYWSFGFVQYVYSTSVEWQLNSFISKRPVLYVKSQGPYKIGTGGLCLHSLPRGCTCQVTPIVKTDWQLVLHRRLLQLTWFPLARYSEQDSTNTNFEINPPLSHKNPLQTVNLIGQPYWAALLGSLIGQPVSTNARFT